DTIADVEQKIAAAFGVDRRRTKMELSFWEYPPDWDPWKDFRKKALTIADGSPRGQKGRGEDDIYPGMEDDIYEDDIYEGDESVDALGGQNQPILVDVEVNQMDGREDTTAFDEGGEECGELRGQKGRGEDDIYPGMEDDIYEDDIYEGDESVDALGGQNQPILVDVEVNQMDGREDTTSFDEGGEECGELSIQLGQRRMRQSWTTSQGWGRSETAIGVVDVEVTVVHEGEGQEGQNQPILVEVEVNQIDGREDATAFVEGGEESGDMSIQLGQTRMRQGGTNSQRTETFDTDNVRPISESSGGRGLVDVTVTPLERREDASTFNAFEEGEGQGNLEVTMGCSVGEESAEMGQIRSQLTMGETMFTELMGDDIVMGRDAAPFRDNAVGVAQDKADMNLRKAGDSIYIGRIFQNKGELHKALTVYSIKRLFNFRIKASDKTRVIAVCHDKKCNWRVYATFHENSENMEIRTASLRHSCDVKARSK
ncbi:unnamed protein product, partial [Arabidopsis halleri]